MFYKYLKRNFDNTLFVAIILLFIFSITLSTIFEINLYKLPPSSGYYSITDFYLTKYNNQDELLLQFEDYRKIIEAWKIDLSTFDTNQIEINKNIFLYEYLIDKKVAFNDIVFSHNTNYFGPNRTGFLESAVSLSVFFSFICFIYFFYQNFVSDFDNKTFIYLYNNKNRLKVSLIKLWSSIFATILVLVFFILLSFIFSIFIRSDTNYIVIETKEKLSILRKEAYLFLYTFIYNFLKLSSLLFICAFIATLIRKGIFYILVMLSIIAIMFVNNMFFSQYSFFFNLSANITSNFHSYNFSVLVLWTIFISISITTIILYLVSLQVFRKIDLI